MRALAAERRGALAVAAGLTAATLLVAGVVHWACAAQMRESLAFPFTELPARFGTVVSIFLNNARLLAAAFAALLVAQSPWLVGGSGPRGRIASTLLVVIDAILGLEVALNILTVGAALGAYGRRMIAAVLPHGPLELGSFSLVLALYLRGRRVPLAGRHIAAIGATSLMGLAVAALLETFVTP